MLKITKASNSDPMIDRAIAEVELAKKHSQIVGSQKEQEQVLSRMGIRFDAGGAVDRSSVSPNKNFVRFTKGPQDRGDLRKEAAL